MQKLYTKKTHREYLLFTGILLLIFFIGTLLFHPTLNVFQKLRRHQQVSQLVSDIQKNDFNMREYWQFREFYSAGSFTFDPQIVSLAGALQFNVIPSPKAILLTFHSAHLESTDSIIDITSSPVYPELEAPKEPGVHVLFALNDRMAYQTVDQKIHLVFLRPSSEMKQTLGVFDYGSKEDKILVQKLWLNETTISE